MVVDGSKGVGAFDALASFIWACAESLAEAAELGTVGGGPCRAEFWVASELAVFQVLAGVRIEDGESPVVKRADGKRRLAAAWGVTANEVLKGTRERVRWATGSCVVGAGEGGGVALVVEDLEVDVMAVLLEAGYDTVGGG